MCYNNPVFNAIICCYLIGLSAGQYCCRRSRRISKIKSSIRRSIDWPAKDPYPVLNLGAKSDACQKQKNAQNSFFSYLKVLAAYLLIRKKCKIQLKRVNIILMCQVIKLIPLLVLNSSVQIIDNADGLTVIVF
jgi:hypothetical protein